MGMDDSTPPLTQRVYHMITELLQANNCMIGCVLQADQVGQDPSRALISATWGVMPLPKESNDAATGDDNTSN